MINSYGYAGTVAPGSTWANMQYTLGSRYFCYGITAGMVIPSVGTARAVDIQSGWIGGWGIADSINTSAGPETVAVDAPASGTEIYLIVARRTWQNVNKTVFAAIDLGQTMPTSLSQISGRNTSPGSIDDQPLAIVSIGPTDTAPTVVYDLRVVGTGKGLFHIAPTTPIALIAGAAYEGLEVYQGRWRVTRRAVWTSPSSAGTTVWEYRKDLFDQNEVGVTEPLTSYPAGTSVMYVTIAGSGGWPITSAGVLLTWKGTAGSYGVQMIGELTGTVENQRLQVRYCVSGTWTNWVNVASWGTPRNQASGQVTITPTAANTAITATVTFPSGRFATAPAVMISSLGDTAPQEAFFSVQSVGTTSCVIRLYRTSTTATTIRWLATEGVDPAS